MTNISFGCVFLRPPAPASTLQASRGPPHAHAPARAHALLPQWLSECCYPRLRHLEMIRSGVGMAAVIRVQTQTPAGFGEVLRRYRVAAGLSQEELAEMAKLSAPGISDLERGARTKPYPATVQRLSKALWLTDADAPMLSTT